MIGGTPWLRSARIVGTKFLYLARAHLGKAGVLIRMGRLDDAEKLLPPLIPRSQLDWSRLLLRTFMLEAKGKTNESRELLDMGSRRAPFARQRRLFSAALARLELFEGRASNALKIVDAVPDEITNVVRLHAFAASGRRQAAIETLSSIRSSEAGAQFADLVAEIARRFRIDSGPPKHSRAWIFAMEGDELVLAAA